MGGGALRGQADPNDRDLVQRELADEEDIQAGAFCEGFQDARDPPKIDRVLHRTPSDDDADGDGPCGPRRYAMFFPH